MNLSSWRKSWLSVTQWCEDSRHLSTSHLYVAGTSSMNRSALGGFPPANWDKIINDSLLKVLNMLCYQCWYLRLLFWPELSPTFKVAPPGLDQLFTMMFVRISPTLRISVLPDEQVRGCPKHGWYVSYIIFRCGSCANEGALKAAFFAYRQRERGDRLTEFSAEELKSCMNNQSPGSPELVAMSFRSGFHGRLFGSLSLTRSKAIHKVHIIQYLSFSLWLRRRSICLTWTLTYAFVLIFIIWC